MTEETTLPTAPGFLWGASTAAHQIEGGNVNSDWWAKEHVAGSLCAESSGDAVDSYHRYPEDIRLLADAGLNAYRFSVEWARIEPAEGEISRAQLAHYRRMIDACLAAGVTPVVTLLHFTLPRWFAERGGWFAPDAIDAYARYVEAVTPILADVRHVVTINEPNITSMMLGASRRTNLDAAGLAAPDEAASEIQATAHRRAVEILHGLGHVRAGWTIANQVFQAAHGAQEARDAYAYPREDFFLEVARGDDFVGVQSYLRTIIGADGEPVPFGDDVEKTLTGWEYYPQALGEALEYTHRITGGVPMIVTENGIATADDSRRIDYTRGALEGMARAMAAGSRVEGYLHWSLLDNYEWMSGFAPTFGLVAVDRTTFERTPKPSLGWLGTVARTGELPG
ncbi:glycoside hydrolase family 1 protein [Promicromonospora thailandica]|uniref:Beta-glucosidase n=1 Tax=Promicromonospora thailandica TaxID=765201 RepID=A0A9X2JWU0_9MICO|nr:family 1 glycosylhydrolase [Promicromonospora thailandica]MCP2265907.1 beta-glucosidase [Promicromonospora thailandica]BFF21523.1 family 1 glycosylhydrolase [Promicromonospora thailandica]